MAKTQVIMDKKSELRDKLSGRELTPEKFIEIAFLNENVQRIDVQKMAKGTWNPYKIHTIQQGFDATVISDFLVQKWGNGRYRLSAVVDGEYAAHKSWSIGEPEDEEIRPINPRAGGGGEDEGEKAVTPSDAVSRAMSKTLSDVAMIQKGQDLVADLQDKAIEREVKPMQLMMDMTTKTMAAMQAAMMKPPTDNGMGQMMTMMMTLLTTSMQTQQALFLKMLEMKDSNKGDRGEGFTQLSNSLGLLEKTLSGRIGELLEAQNSGDKGTDWAAIAAVAAPVLERTLGVLERTVANRPAPALPRPAALPMPAGAVAQGQVFADTPVAETTFNGENNMQIHPDPEMDAALKEAAALGVELLRSKDFEGLYKLMELNFADLLEKFDPAIGKKTPMIYTMILKRINPQFDKLREEFSQFCDWAISNEAADEDPGVDNGNDEAALEAP